MAKASSKSVPPPLSLAPEGQTGREALKTAGRYQLTGWRPPQVRRLHPPARDQHAEPEPGAGHYARTKAANRKRIVVVVVVVVVVAVAVAATVALAKAVVAVAD